MPHIWLGSQRSWKTRSSWSWRNCPPSCCPLPTWLLSRFVTTCESHPSASGISQPSVKKHGCPFCQPSKSCAKCDFRPMLTYNYAEKGILSEADTVGFEQSNGVVWLQFLKDHSDCYCIIQARHTCALDQGVLGRSHTSKQQAKDLLMD